MRLEDYVPRPAVRRPETRVARPAAPVIDAHNHLGRWLAGWVDRPGQYAVQDVGALVARMDALGIEAIVNLDGRADELEDDLDRYDRAYPGRFLTFCQVDWYDVLSDGDARRQVAFMARARDAGARGLKVWKDLGLYIDDPTTRAKVLPDDERLAPVFDAAGDLGLPVLIHTADPIAFFDPADRFNERYEEVGANPDWSFSDAVFPRFETLMTSLETLLARHPATTFIGAHVLCCAEDLGWVRRILDTYPNAHLDISARIAELGRVPRAARALLCDHSERVLFGTDAFPPDDEVYRLHFRFLETADEYFDYHLDGGPPPQGRWAISGLDLPRDVLEQVYAGNARRLLDP